MSTALAFSDIPASYIICLLPIFSSAFIKCAPSNFSLFAQSWATDAVSFRVLLRRRQMLGSGGSFHSLLCLIWKLSEVNCFCSFFQDAFKRLLETSTCFHVWKFNFGKYRLPHTMHWGAFGECQPASGVSTMLPCEEKMYFWKETTSTFQTWVSHTEFSASAVVVGNLLLFWVGLEPRNRPALLHHI